MTRSQEMKIEYLRKEAEKMMNEYHREGEIKRFEVEDCGSFISVIVEVGGKNDEGTMAAIFCREDAHIFIGKRGAMTFPVWDTKNKKQVRRKFIGLWLTYYDQKNNVLK